MIFRGAWTTKLSALVALALAVCCRQTDPVILSLDDQVVRRSDFERHVAELETRGGSRLGLEVKRALLETFLEQRVLVLEARARGLLGPRGTPEEERRAVQKLLADATRPAPEPTDEDVAVYYREHASELQIPETVTVRQILVPTLNEARDVQRRLLKQPKSFETLARSASRGPEAANGGLMGVFSRGQLPPSLEAVAFSLPPGMVSELVDTSFGYHILRVESREPARAPSLEESQARIRALLSRQKSDQKIRQYVADLMARAKVNHEAARIPPRPS